MKKQVKILNLLVACSLLLTAGTLDAQNKIPPGFVLKGYIDGAPAGTNVHLVDIEGQKILDSAIITTGSFVLKGHVDQPTGCWLRCGNENAVLQVENTSMTFKAPFKDLEMNYVATGGREQALQTELNQQLRHFDLVARPAYDSISRELYTDPAHRARLVKTYNTAMGKYMEAYVNFGRKHSNSYLGLDILYRNRQKLPKDSLLLWYNAMPSPLNASSEAQALKLFAAGSLVHKGDHFLDFSATTIKGRPFKLSDLKGKYIYLSFGSVGCGPCRAENREIATQYDTLHQRLEIVYFSLDVNQKEWELVAKQDGIVWHNVSDMKGMTGGQNIV